MPTHTGSPCPREPECISIPGSLLFGCPIYLEPNFEKWALSGGADFTYLYGNKMKSLEGMARWTPIIDGKKCVKGGVGTYHMEYEYTIDGTEESYPYLRNAIRIMNPPVK